MKPMSSLTLFLGATLLLAIIFAMRAVLTRKTVQKDAHVPVMGLIRAALITIWERSGRPDDIQPGFLVSDLLMMVSLLAFWALIFFICARFYYSKAPVSLRDEMIKEMD